MWNDIPQIISYTLREIKDEESYMESMGQSRTSEVQRDARIGEAECNRQVFDDHLDWLMIVMNMDMNITVIIKISIQQ